MQQRNVIKHAPRFIISQTTKRQRNHAPAALLRLGALAQRLTFISRRGFTAQAVEYARIKNVVLVTEKDIPGIKQLID